MFPNKGSKIKRSLWLFSLILCAFVFAAFCIIPFMVYIVATFIPSNLQTNGLSKLGVLDLTFINYGHFFFENSVSAKEFQSYLVNTIYISSLNSIIVVIVTFMGAYIETRFRYHGQNIINKISLVGYLFPPVILIFPYAILLQKLDLIRTTNGLVIANVAFCLPFASWLMINFMKAVPYSFDRSAAADGANWWQSLFRIILPRMMPGIGAVFIFSFILSWNDVVLALRLAEENSYTLSAGVFQLLENQETSDYGVIAAGGLMVTIIAIVFFCIIQWRVDKQLINDSEE